MNNPDLTLKEAVEFLGSSEESYQQWGATFIQHTTYTDESAKSEVRAGKQKITVHAYCEEKHALCIVQSYYSFVFLII